jgi:hypothetical protein
MKEGNYLGSKKKCYLKYILTVSIAIVIFGTTTYLLGEFGRITQISKEKQAVSDKVTIVMRMFNCDNPEIHAAILDTFDPVLIAIVVGVESEYNVNAISPAGCRGLMQLSPEKLKDWKNIRRNIQVGSSYLEEQLKRFGSLELAVAAYNAGPESVTKYKGIPPFRETKEYVQRAKLLSLAFDHFLPWTTEREHQVL